MHRTNNVIMDAGRRLLGLKTSFGFIFSRPSVMSSGSIGRHASCDDWAGGTAVFVLLPLTKVDNEERWEAGESSGAGARSGALCSSLCPVKLREREEVGCGAAGAF
jgi:hypothetical protein